MMQNKKWIAVMLITSLTLSGVSVDNAAAAGRKKMAINKKKMELKVGGKQKLKVKNAKKKVTWRSSNKKVASVSKKGLVKAKKAGKAKITARVAKKKFVCNVTVKEKNSKKATAAPIVTQSGTPSGTPVPTAVVSQNPVPTPTASPTVTPVLKMTPELSCLTSEVDGYGKKWELRFQIKNGTFKTNLSKEVCKLSGAFADLQITDLKTKDDILTANLEGDLVEEEADKYWGGADIDLTEIVNHEFGEKDITKMQYNVQVLYPALFADTEKVSLKDKKLYLPLSVSDMDYAEELSVEDFSVKGAEGAALEGVETTAEAQTIYLIFAASDSITETMKKLNGAVISYKKGETSYQTGILYHEPVLYASLGLTKSNEEETVLLGALQCAGGSLDNLTEKDLTLQGESFLPEQSTIKNVTYDKDAGVYSFEIHMPAGLDEDAIASLYGTLEVAGEKVKNTYGEKESGTFYADLYLTTETANDAELPEAGGFWDVHGKEIKEGFGTVGQVATAIKFVYTILELTGVVESTESRQEAMYKTLQETKRQIEELSTQLYALSVQTQTSSIQAQYSTAYSRWYDNFYRKAMQLQSRTNSYLAGKNDQMLKLLLNTKGVTVYTDTKGNVTAPKYENDGKKSETESFEQNQLSADKPVYEVSGLILKDGKTVEEVLRSNRTTYKDAFANNTLNDIKALLQKEYGTEKGTQIYDSILVQGAYENAYQFEVKNAQGYLEMYLSTFQALLDRDVTGKRPLDYFDEMLSLQYNFDSETHSAKDEMRNYINMLFHVSSTMAFEVENACMTADTSEYEKLLNDFIGYMSGNTGYLDTNTADEIPYSFVLNSKVQLKQMVCNPHWEDGYYMGKGWVASHYFDITNYGQVCFTNGPIEMLLGITQTEHFGVGEASLMKISDLQVAEMQRRSRQNGYNDIYANLQQQMPSAANVLSAKCGFMTQPIRSERFTYSGASNNANLQCIHAGGGKWYYLQWCNHKSWDKLTNLWVQTVSGGNYTTGSSIAIIAAYKEWNGKDYIFRNDTFVKPLFYLARG